MNHTETMESNRLVWEFMFDDEQYKHRVHTRNPEIFDSLEYHEDWNELMAVLQKIEDNSDKIPEDSNAIGDITHGLVDYDIVATFEAAVEAVKIIQANGQVEAENETEIEYFAFGEELCRALGESFEELIQDCKNGHAPEGIIHAHRPEDTGSQLLAKAEGWFSFSKLDRSQYDQLCKFYGYDPQD